MKKFLSYLFLVSIISGFIPEMVAMSATSKWFKQRYHSFMLGGLLYNKLNTKCDQFRGKPEEIRKVVDNSYEVPWLLQKAQFFLPWEESLVTYAQALYRDIEQIMESLKETLGDKRFNDNLGAGWRALEQTIQLLTKEKEEEGLVTVTQKEITDNIDRAIKLLEDFKEKLNEFINKGVVSSTQGERNPQVNEPSAIAAKQVEEKKERIKNARNTIQILEDAINKLKALRAKKKLTWIERKHRNIIFNRAQEYNLAQCR